jgi:hypothetical protein
MKKEFVPYKQALELKELGFNEPCFALYSAIEGENHKFLWATSSIDHIIETIKKGNKFFDDSKGDKTRIQHFIKNSYTENTITAPLYQQAFKFFREKYGYDVSIKKCTPNEYKFEIEQLFVEGDNYYFIDFVFKTYEEAELACLIKLIEIVK